MAIDIFEFWSKIAPDERIHAADKEVFRRSKHRFDHDVLPGSFMGPLKTAPLVLLFLSPGRSDGDAITNSLIDWHRRTREGYESLISEEQHPSAYKWWVSRTRSFGFSPAQLRDKVAILNIGAYHSKAFSDHGLLAALPSSRVSLDWAQGVLFPEAMEGKRVVVCLRAAKYWGLGEGSKDGEALFAPDVTRGGHMLKGGLRSEIVAKVREILK